MSSGLTGCILPAAMVISGKYPASDAVGVGQDEEPTPAVASASFSRRKQSRLNAETHCLKVCDDFGESQIEMPFDIFAEDPLRLHFADDPGDLWPEVARVGASPGSAICSPRSRPP